MGGAGSTCSAVLYFNGTVAQYLDVTVPVATTDPDGGAPLRIPQWRIHEKGRDRVR